MCSLHCKHGVVWCVLFALHGVVYVLCIAWGGVCSLHCMYVGGSIGRSISPLIEFSYLECYTVFRCFIIMSK